MAESYPDSAYPGVRIRQPSLPNPGEIIYGDEKCLEQFVTSNIHTGIGLDTGVILESCEKYICLKQIQGNIYAKDFHYDVKCELGKGGLGTVYKCVDKNSNEVFVIKRVKMSDNPMHMKSLDREVNTLLIFTHPYIIKIYGIIQRKEGFIDVLLEPWGESLKAYFSIQRKTCPKTSDICLWFYQILLVLNDFHRNDLFHCDIHFGNILISISNNKIKLCDLGSSKKIGEKHGTQSHGISPMYFPPTVLRHYLKCLNEEPSLKRFDYLVSARLDTFAVGKLLLELMKEKYINIKDMCPYIYDKTKWDEFVKDLIPKDTPIGIKEVITGLMGYTTRDSISTDEAIDILFKETGP